MQTLTAIIKAPGCKPKKVKVQDSYQATKNLIGGYIEHIYPMEDSSIVFIADEEAKIKNLKPNVWIRDKRDIICGPIIVLGTDGDDFYSSLTTLETTAVMEYLKQNDATDYKGGLEPFMPTVYKVFI